MDLGPLNRRGSLFTNNQTVGPSGAVIDNYVCLRPTLWLTYVNPSTRTVLAGQRDANETQTSFKSRWFEGAVNGMVLKVEGRTYRNVRFVELGRREGYQIFGQENA